MLEAVTSPAFRVERTLLAKEQGRVVDHYACDFVGLTQVVHGFFQALLVVGAKIAVISDRYGEFLWMAALKPAGPCSSLEQLLIAKLFNEFLGIVEHEIQVHGLEFGHVCIDTSLSRLVDFGSSLLTC